MPWREDGPLLFHLISPRSDSESEERRRFLRLLRSGTCLVPAVERAGSDASRHGIRDIDDMAGDSRYLFLTVGRPFDAVDTHLLNPPPAVAFTIEALLVDRPLGPTMERFISHDRHLGWRPHDLIGAYEEAADAIDPDTSVDYNFYASQAVYKIAERWTIFDPAEIGKLLRLEQRLLQHHREAPRLRAEARDMLERRRRPGDGKRIRPVKFLDLSRSRWGKDESRSMKWPETLESHPVRGC